MTLRIYQRIGPPGWMLGMELTPTPRKTNPLHKSQKAISGQNKCRYPVKKLTFSKTEGEEGDQLISGWTLWRRRRRFSEEYVDKFGSKSGGSKLEKH